LLAKVFEQATKMCGLNWRCRQQAASRCLEAIWLEAAVKLV
jgi:hypothetical protein